MSERHEILRFLAALNNPDDVIELRVLDHCPSGSRWSNTLSGYFSDREKLVEAALRASPRSKGVYVIMNEIDPALLARRANEAAEVPKGEPVTGDSEVLRRRFILLDFDPKRPTGIASADHEHEAALKIARDVRTALAAEGWPASALVDTGNGAAAYYAVDLPAEDGGLVERTLKGLALRFGTKEVELDTSVHNPARLCRLPGTLNRKGSNTKDRPHRWCRILELPEHLPPVSEDLLEAVATPPPSPGGRTAGPLRGSFDIDSWIRERGLEVEGPEPWNGGRRWVFRTCPFNSTHTNGSAFILQLSSGAVAAGCHHNGCSGRDWHALRDTVEPGWRGEGRRWEWNGARGPGGAKPAREDDDEGDEEHEAQEPVLTYKEFPVRLLPKVAREFVEAAAEAHGVSPGFFAPPLLAVVAAVIGDSRSVLLKSGYTEPSILWTCSIARSGAGKSPAAREVLKLSRRITSALRNQFLAEMKAFEEELREWKKLPKSQQRETDMPRPPAERRLKVSDTTFEGLVGILEFNQRGLLLAADELAQWLDFDRYSGGKAKVGAARWLPLWAGEEVDYDRRTDRTHIYIPRGYLSVTGSIPPKAFAAVIGEERMSDGLLARVLLSSPPDAMAGWSERKINPQILEGMEEGLESLYRLQQGPGKYGPEPVPLPLTREARSVWVREHDDLVWEAGDMSDAMRAAASKARAYAARIAFILALLDNPDETTVSESWMEAGWGISLWFLREHRRALGRMSERPAAKDLRIGEELLRRLGGRATVREMCRAASRYSGKGGADRAEAMGNRLVAANMARWEFSAPGPSGGWTVRTLVLTQAVDTDTCSTFRPKTEQVSVSTAHRGSRNGFDGPADPEEETSSRDPGEDSPEDLWEPLS